MQDPKMNFFHEACLDIESLQMYFARVRDDLCRDSIVKRKDRCDMWGIAVERRIRRRRRMPGEMKSDAGLTAEEEIVRIMKGALDRLQQEMTTIFTRLRDLDKKLGFLLHVDFKRF